MHVVCGDYILAVEITYIVACSTLRSIPSNGHGIFLYEHVTKIMNTVLFCHTPDPLCEDLAKFTIAQHNFICNGKFMTVV